MPHEMEQQEIQPSSGGLGAPECGWPNHGRPTAFRARVVSLPQGVKKAICLIADLITSGGSQGPPDAPEHFSGLFWLAQAFLLPAGRTSEISSVRHGQLPSGNGVPKDVLAGRNLQRNYWMMITPTKEESEHM